MIENKTPYRLKAKYISSEFCISIPASKHKTLISMPVVAVERLGLGKCCIFLHLHASEDLRGCLLQILLLRNQFQEKSEVAGRERESRGTTKTRLHQRTKQQCKNNASTTASGNKQSHMNAD